MSEPARILVVDDNPANREILETRLVSQGYEVITAEDGDEALRRAREHTPDLILLDVMMPGKDAFRSAAS
jgi:CheY-like chemotaxis protein